MPNSPWSKCRMAIQLAALVPAVGFFYLPLLRGAYVGLAYVTYPIGFVISHLLVGFVYYFVITPAGLLLRLFKGDPLKRAADPAATTYWVKRPEQPSVERYFRQF